MGLNITHNETRGETLHIYAQQCHSRRFEPIDKTIRPHLHNVIHSAWTTSLYDRLKYVLCPSTTNISQRASTQRSTRPSICHETPMDFTSAPLDLVPLPPTFELPTSSFTTSEPPQEQPKPSLHSEYSWGYRPPTPDPYPTFFGPVEFATYDGTTLTTERYESRTRAQVERGLTRFHAIRRYLVTNFDLLGTYGEDSLTTRVPPGQSITYADFEIVQNLFAQQHCGIFECLNSVADDYFMSYGLPGGSDFRYARNVFSHSFLTGGDSGIEKIYLQGLRDRYDSLYKLVMTTIQMLEDQLADKSNWTEPKRNAVVDEPREAELLAQAWNNAAELDRVSHSVSQTTAHDAPQDAPQNAHQNASQDAPEASTPSPSLLLRAFRFVYFRSPSARSFVDRVVNAAWNVHVEYAEAGRDVEHDIHGEERLYEHEHEHEQYYGEDGPAREHMG
jgi:hypothetical protein